MRSPPGPADRALLARLAEEGYPTSVAQLERWRFHGLLPRNEHRGLGRGRGSTSAPPEGFDVFEMARDLAWLSQGRMPWQGLIAGLFEMGWNVPEPHLRTAGKWMIDRNERLLTQLIRSGLRDGTLDEHDLATPDAAGAAIAHRHRYTRSLRPWLRAARDMARLDHPHANRRELAQLATDYLGAVLAERLGDYTVVADAVLPGTGHAQGVQGSGSGRPAVSIWRLQACAATLTQDEAEAAREALIEQLNAGASREGYSLLYLTISVVTLLRLEELGDPRRRVPAKTLNERLGAPGPSDQ